MGFWLLFSRFIIKNQNRTFYLTFQAEAKTLGCMWQGLRGSALTSRPRNGLGTRMTWPSNSSFSSNSELTVCYELPPAECAWSVAASVPVGAPGGEPCRREESTPSFSHAVHSKPRRTCFHGNVLGSHGGSRGRWCSSTEVWRRSSPSLPPALPVLVPEAGDEAPASAWT